MFASLRNRFEISPHRYAQVTTIALIGLALIVFSGAAVRLTDSGLVARTGPSAMAPARTRRSNRTRSSSQATGSSPASSASP